MHSRSPKFSLVILLPDLVFFFPIISSLIEVDFNPLSFVIFLNLNGKLFEPIEVLDLANVRLKLLLATIVQDAGDDCFEDLRQLVPEDSHYDEHDQIE